MNFSPEQIKSLLENEAPVLNNIIDFTLFVVNISKKLFETVKDETITKTDKVNATVEIGKQIVEQLEGKGVITFEVAQSFREVLGNTASFIPMIDSLFGETFNKIVEEVNSNPKYKSIFQILTSCATFCVSKK